jgi:HlyD family secretion protein
MRETLVRDLALDAGQQTKLDAILDEARQALAGLRGQGGDEKAIGAQRRRVRTEVRDKVRSILTPDQQKRFDALVASQDGGTAPGGTAARVYVPGADGKPRAVAIMVGLTDGTYSEVVSGELQAGHDVLVGTPSGTPARAPTAGPRLRL